MNLLDQVTTKIKEMKEEGIAIASIRCIVDSETVEIVVGRLETRDIFEPGKDSNPEKSIDDKYLDLYHIG